MEWLSNAIKRKSLLHLNSLIFNGIILDNKTFKTLQDGISSLKEFSLKELNLTSCTVPNINFDGILSLLREKLLPNLERLIMPRTEVSVDFAIKLKETLYRAVSPNILSIVLTVDPEGIEEVQKCIQSVSCSYLKEVKLSMFYYNLLVLPSTPISDKLTEICNNSPLTCNELNNPCIKKYI